MGRATAACSAGLPRASCVRSLPGRVSARCSTLAAARSSGLRSCRTQRATSAGCDDPWSGRERVGVMSEALHGLAGGGEVPLEAPQGVDGSLKRPSQPARELVCGARFVDGGEQRFDGAVVCRAEPVEIVGRTAP
jgi:hypothetical protein